MEQRTDDWHAARLGKITASRIADLMARTKSGPAASRANYLAELLCERLTGHRTDGFVSAAMLHGIDQEPYARQAYCARFGCDVFEVGFIDHPEIPMSGASPDGYVGDDGLIEVKCPNTATHLDTLLNGTLPDKYFLQMQWQMACTGRQWCDFISFDPRLPAHLQLFVERVPRNVSMILDLESAVLAAHQEIEARIKALSERYKQREAA